MTTIDTLKPLPCQLDLDPRRHGCEVPDGRPVFTMTLDIAPPHLGEVIPHAPNTLYLQWMEDLAFSHSRSLGYDGPFYMDRQACFFVRKHEMEYLGEVFEGDRLHMATWVMWINKSRTERRHLIVRAADDKPVFTGATLWVFVDLATRRPIRVPDEMAGKFLLGK